MLRAFYHYNGFTHHWGPSIGFMLTWPLLRGNAGAVFFVVVFFLPPVFTAANTTVLQGCRERASWLVIDWWTCRLMCRCELLQFHAEPLVITVAGVAAYEATRPLTKPQKKAKQTEWRGEGNGGMCLHDTANTHWTPSLKYGWTTRLIVRLPTIKSFDTYKMRENTKILHVVAKSKSNTNIKRIFFSVSIFPVSFETYRCEKLKLIVFSRTFFFNFF